jgi:hypothetical protein
MYPYPTTIIEKEKKIREQESRTGPTWGFGTSGREEEVEKGCRRVNIVQILCTYVCK